MINLKTYIFNKLISSLRKKSDVKSIDFGDLRRLEPFSDNWGFERGIPVDRYYIEEFLSAMRHHVRGDVLEIGEDTYTKKFGDNRISKIDILHISNDYAHATIIADLTSADHIESDRFDTIIITQTLQCIYDISSAVATLYRILKPGGVVLATFPGITQTYDKEWKEYWYWNFTLNSAKKLFSEYFNESNIEVFNYGNVFTAMCFLFGLSREEIYKSELDYKDSGYVLTIGVKAVK